MFITINTVAIIVEKLSIQRYRHLMYVVRPATNINNEPYGMDRLGEILNKVKLGTPHEILPAIKKDIDEFVGEAPQFDDITMLCLEYKTKMEIKEEDAQ